MRIRAGAALEVPHIVVLIDDPEHTVIAPLIQARRALPRLYDFDLMLGSGHLTGYTVDDPALEQQAVAALSRLAEREVFAARYNLGADAPPLLFAVGDGNHSLATAKAIWEQIKPQVGMEHPARYALVEVENIHDPGLIFEPIHRVLFGARSDTIAALLDFYADRCRLVPCANAHTMMELVEREERPEHTFGIITADGFTVAYVADPPSNLPVGTLQNFLDAWGKAGGYARIDYVHGSDVVERLAAQPGNMGFYVPTLCQEQLFQDGHRGRRPAAQDLLDGRGARETLLHGSATDCVRLVCFEDSRPSCGRGARPCAPLASI